MKSTWTLDLYQLLSDARKGNKAGLETLLAAFPRETAVNADYSILLVIRSFEVHTWKGKRNVLNAPAEGNPGQTGITIVTAGEMGGSQQNVFVPNSVHLSAITIQGDAIGLITKRGRIDSNLVEILRKLDFSLDVTEDAIEAAFLSICNEQYQRPEKAVVNNTELELPAYGTLTYSPDLDWFEGDILLQGNRINLNIANAGPLQEMLNHFVLQQLDSGFHQIALQKMEDDMIELKNDNWLDEGEEEVNPELFRSLIRLESIVFHEDRSCTIYCTDGGLFHGHSIEIQINIDGDYKSANLAG